MKLRILLKIFMTSFLIPPDPPYLPDSLQSLSNKYHVHKGLNWILKLPVIFEKVPIQNGLKWSKMSWNCIKWSKIFIFAYQKWKLSIKMMDMSVNRPNFISKMGKSNYKTYLLDKNHLLGLTLNLIIWGFKRSLGGWVQLSLACKHLCKSMMSEHYSAQSHQSFTFILKRPLCK